MLLIIVSSTRPGFLLVEWLLSPIRNCWLPSRYSCHSCTLRIIMSDHAGHFCGSQMSWLDRTVGCFPPLEACMALWVPCKLVLREETFTSITPRAGIQPLGSVFDVHCVFSTRSLPYISGCGATKSNSNTLQCFGSLLDNSDQQLKEGFPSWCQGFSQLLSHPTTYLPSA